MHVYVQLTFHQLKNEGVEQDHTRRCLEEQDQPVPSGIEPALFYGLRACAGMRMQKCELRAG